MATTPNFVKTPRKNSVSISTANTNRDGTGTVGTVFTANATYGSRIERIVVKATVTTSAGMIRLFTHDGTNFFPWEELDVTAVTVAATTKAWVGVVTFGGSSRSYSSSTGLATLILPGPGLILPPSHSLRASTEIANTFIVTAEGGDFDI